MLRVVVGLVAVLSLNAQPVPPARAQCGALGKYRYKLDWISSVPGLKQGPPNSASIAYPIGAAGEKFPFVVFGHGAAVGGSYPPVNRSYADVIQILASYGHIVVQPESCTSMGCGARDDFVKDMLATLTSCKEKPSLHPALASADFSTVGIMGHSLGGVATVAACAQADSHSIKGCVAEHPCFADIKASQAPIMITSGSADAFCSSKKLQKLYDATPASVPKVFFDVKGADHFEPGHGGPCREVLPSIQFMACSLRGEECDKVYGTSGKEICTQDFTLSHCAASGGTEEKSSLVVV